MNGSPLIHVVDDDDGMRRSLRWILESAGWTVRTYQDAVEFLANYPPDAPGCLVLDVRIPGISGVDLLDQLAAQRIELPVIVITGHGTVESAVRAMRHGVVDFIEKPIDDQVLLDRVAQAVSLNSSRRDQQSRRTELVKRLETLTPREREVMRLVVEGHPNKRIAAMLDRSEKTVEIHRAQVMRKMEAESLAELVRLADAALDALKRA